MKKPLSLLLWLFSPVLIPAGFIIWLLIRNVGMGPRR